MIRTHYYNLIGTRGIWKHMDVKTLFMVLVSVFLVQAVALYQSWRQNTGEIGIRDWATGAALMAVGSMLSAVGMYPFTHDDGNAILLATSFVKVMGNAFGVGGWFLIWIGIRHFFQRQGPSYTSVSALVVTLALVMLLESLSTFLSDWRVFVVSASIGMLSGLSFVELMRPQTKRNTTLLLFAMAMLATSLIWSLRAMSILLPNVFDIHTFYVLSLYDGVVASVASTISMILLINERINEQLLDQALKDPLTGLINRRAFYERGRRLLALSTRGDASVAICIIDLDYFKAINDSYGHAAGDVVLKHFSQLARRTLREGDLIARYGGEEFVILLHDSGIDTTRQIMERLRLAWEQAEIHVNGQIIQNTLSAGVAQVTGVSPVKLEKLLAFADENLYEAKNMGCNKVLVTAYTPESGDHESETALQGEYS